MKINITHNKDKDTAIDCAKHILERLKKEYGEKISNPVQIWTDDKARFSFRMRGISIEGVINVTDNEVIISGKLPLAAQLFKGVIEDTITRQTKQLLENCDNKDA